jgi:hypothetical protein
MARFAATRAAAAALYDGTGGASLGAIPTGVVAGTRIATQSGARPVEDLRAGDLLASGHRVIATNRRTLNADALARDADARPVHIGVGALADGLPARALVVAPAQLLRIDGEAVPAAALVNGASITRPRTAGAVTYVRLRLDAPACFIAESVACDGFDRRAGNVAAIARVRRATDPRSEVAQGVLDGDVAEFDRCHARGWALDKMHPTSVRVVLEFAIGGKVVGHALANVRRPDLEMAGLGDGRCGFSARLSPPLDAGRHAIVEVRRVGDGAAMPRTPLLLLAPSAGPATFECALKQSMEQATSDLRRQALASFLARQLDRLLQARGEHPPVPPPAPAA